MTNENTTTHQFGALETRVSVLSDEVHNIRQSIASLHTKFDQGRAIPWGAISSGLGALAIMGGVIIWGFGAYIAQIQIAQKQTTDDIDRLVSVIVPRAELEDRRIVSNGRTQRIEEDIQKIMSEIVPRGEHAEHWRGQETADANLQKQIDKIASDFAQVFPLGDAIRETISRVERLERMRLMTRQQEAQ